jgi:hypothetical protein
LNNSVNRFFGILYGHGVTDRLQWPVFVDPFITSITINDRKRIDMKCFWILVSYFWLYAT